MLVLAGAGAGCGSISVYARGVSPLNVNDHEESTPVDVRFYQLRRDARFRTASFDQLWLSDSDALGPDKLGERVVATVPPGTGKDRAVEIDLGKRDGDTAFIGVMALYRRAAGADVRTLVIPVADASSRVLTFTGSTIELRSDDRPAERSDNDQPQPRDQR
ncbi:MAG: type VI secretion system lipoprotein TssJ [Planctomycetes bacterium]|nr:type VI secretion system lipoprotein TssJ [Planctomycetota bacterium]